MLPDGAERQAEDWTIFFLNQTPFNTIAPVLALETPKDKDEVDEEQDDGKRPELLYVLNLVRTKLDKTVRRCVTTPSFARVMSMLCPQRSYCQSNGYLHQTLLYRDIQGTSLVAGILLDLIIFMD